MTTAEILVRYVTLPDELEAALAGFSKSNFDLARLAFKLSTSTLDRLCKSVTNFLHGRFVEVSDKSGQAVLIVI